MGEMEIVIFGARKYRFQDRMSGELREGIRITYALLPFRSSDDGAVRGYVCDAVSIPLGLWDRLVTVPGVYRVEMAPTSLRGRPQVVGLEYVAPVEVLAGEKVVSK